MIKLFAAYIITMVLREANELSFYDIFIFLWHLSCPRSCRKYHNFPFPQQGFWQKLVWQVFTSNHLYCIPRAVSLVLQQNSELRAGIAQLVKHPTEKPGMYNTDAGLSLRCCKGYFSQSAFSADSVTVSTQPLRAVACISTCVHT